MTDTTAKATEHEARTMTPQKSASETESDLKRDNIEISSGPTSFEGEDAALEGGEKICASEVDVISSHEVYEADIVIWRFFVIVGW